MKHIFLICSYALSIVCLANAAQVGQPIRLHPSNPHWLEWRGKATALITSAEHYGAVLNLDFNYRQYLETLERDGMNYTRIFSGSYVEPPGAFGIQRNTLAPAPTKFLAPWEKSDQPGYAGGGNKLDLDRFSLKYLARLKDFISEADRRGVVVELTLFCSTYSDQQWALHPFNPTNNIQALAVSQWKTLHTFPTDATEDQLLRSPIFQHQERLTRWLVREVNAFDNVFFEIQNEPWADNHSMGDFINPYLTDKYSFPNAVEVTSAQSVAWQRAIARIIADEESRLPKRHMIAQNAANFRLALKDSDLVPEAGIVHFHYAYPEAVDWNRNINRIIGYDETGFAGKADATYQRQAWNFIWSGGGIFNNLDYSFTVGHEDGADILNRAPGGGSPVLRQQLKVLSQFLHSFNLALLWPDTTFVRRAPGVLTRTLSQPGKAYALYLQGRGPTQLSVHLPEGRWKVDWLNIENGQTILSTAVVGNKKEPVALASPDFKDAIAVRLILE